MRVTTTGFTEQFKQQTNDSLYTQYNLQNKIASGLAFTKPSDDPVNFSLLKFQQTQQSETKGYSAATDEAKLEATRNYQAMSDLQRTISRANELMQGSNATVGPEGLKAMGQEMQTLLAQVQEIANRNYDGYNAFGSTNNAQPVASVPSNLATGSLTYNVGNGQAKQMQIDSNSSSITVGILAGDPGANPLTAAAAAAADTGGITSTNDGFLVQAGATGASVGSTTVSSTGVKQGVDVMAFIYSAAVTLQSGQAISQDQRINMLRAGEYVAENVGKTSATLAQFDLNKQALSSLSQSGTERIANLSEANLPALSTDLSRASQAYQGALASGAKILQMSLLDYLH